VRGKGQAGAGTGAAMPNPLSLRGRIHRPPFAATRFPHRDRNIRLKYTPWVDSNSNCHSFLTHRNWAVATVSHQDPLRVAIKERLPIAIAQGLVRAAYPATRGHLMEPA
jgi:hypothetical protein